MKLFDKSFFSVLSALFTDLTAAWIATIVITPAIVDVSYVRLLTTNIVPAIVSLGVAIFLAKKAKEYE